MHRCGGITLQDNGGNGNHDDFVFPSHGQLLLLANGSQEPPVSGIKFPLNNLVDARLRPADRGSASRAEILLPG